jgi:D-serine deaminase-like pyridoxal phosphate-dependent protein
MASSSIYSHASKEALRKEFVGKSIKDVGSPAAVLDLAIVQQNCSKMLEAVDILDFGWRAHIKTHKVRITVLFV